MNAYQVTITFVADSDEDARAYAEHVEEKAVGMSVALLYGDPVAGEWRELSS